MKTQPSSGDLKKLPQTPLLERRQQEGTTITPMPIGLERVAALRDLGATFEEGKTSITKVATPTETILPSFVDTEQLENILEHKKEESSQC